MGRVYGGQKSMELYPIQHGTLTGDRGPGCGWCARGYGFVTVQCVDMRRWFEVAGFNVAAPDHPACRKHVQSGSELSTPCTLRPHMMKRRHENVHGSSTFADGLHPENAPEVFVDLPRAMTLGAPRIELSHL
jgi:hypothetical protein